MLPIASSQNDSTFLIKADLVKVRAAFSSHVKPVSLPEIIELNGELIPFINFFTPHFHVLVLTVHITENSIFH